jgi:hypothetical protein
MRKLLPILALVLLLKAAAAGAVVSTAAPLLGESVDARTISMGDVGVADNSDPSTIFFNPANVVAGPRLYVLGSQQRFEGDFFNADDIWVRRARAGFSWARDPKSWKFGGDVTYSRFDFGNVVATNTAGNVLVNSHSYEEAMAIALGLAFSPGSYNIRFGAGVKEWRAHYPSAEVTQTNTSFEANAFTFDAGAAITHNGRFGAWNVTPSLGVAMMDAGQDVDFGLGSPDPLPTRFNYGASVRLESSPAKILNSPVPMVSVVCVLDGVSPLHGDFEWGAGDEIAFAQMLFLRSGVHSYSPNGSGTSTNATWGAGIGIPAGPLRARFDYGRLTNGYEKDRMSVLVEWLF